MRREKRKIRLLKPVEGKFGGGYEEQVVELKPSEIPHGARWEPAPDDVPVTTSFKPVKGVVEDDAAA